MDLLLITWSPSFHSIARIKKKMYTSDDWDPTMPVYDEDDLYGEQMSRAYKSSAFWDLKKHRELNKERSASDRNYHKTPARARKCGSIMESKRYKSRSRKRTMRKCGPMTSKMESRSYHSRKRRSRVSRVSNSRRYGSRKKKSMKKPRVRIPIKKGGMEITRNGRTLEYHIKDTERKRRTVLNALVKHKSSGLQVHQRLIALRTLGKRRLTRDQYNTLTADANYVKRLYYGTSYWKKRK